MNPNARLLLVFIACAGCGVQPVEKELPPMGQRLTGDHCASDAQCLEPNCGACDQCSVTLSGRTFECGCSCVDPSCSNGMEDGDETGVDCGGKTCSACGAGQGCFADA